MKRTWLHSLNFSLNEADNYLRPFDLIKIDRGIFDHVGIYLGNGYICHFSGNKVGSIGSEGLVVKKDTLRNFFQGETKSQIQIIRPIIKFKGNYRLIRDITRSISKEYGKGQYGFISNNCEHFANLVLFGIRASSQGNTLNSFTSYPINLKEEIEAADDYFFKMDIFSSSEEFEKIEEILANNKNKESYGNWEARIEVNNRNLDSGWCKIM